MKYSPAVRSDEISGNALVHNKPNETGHLRTPNQHQRDFRIPDQYQKDCTLGDGLAPWSRAPTARLSDNGELVGRNNAANPRLDSTTCGAEVAWGGGAHVGKLSNACVPRRLRKTILAAPPYNLYRNFVQPQTLRRLRFSRDT